MKFRYPSIFNDFSQSDHNQTLARLKLYKNKFNPNISDKFLNDLLNNGFSLMESDDIKLQSPHDILSLIWAIEYINAADGHVSKESFLKVVDNGRFYEALVNYSNAHNETVHKTSHIDLLAYPYRRISSHSSAYSGEKQVDSLNPFSKSKIPLQYGIDIRGKSGPMLPGAKNTILFHKEDPKYNQGHKVVGIKYEHAGFPDFNLKYPKHTFSEAFDHVDQFIATRENPAGRVISSSLDVVKSAINLPFALLSYSYIKPFSYISSVENSAHKKANSTERLFQPIIDIIYSTINSITSVISLGQSKPLGDKPKDDTSFREHCKDVIFNGEKIGKDITKFAKSVEQELNLKGDKVKAIEIKSALKIKRIGNIMQALHNAKSNMYKQTLQKFEHLDKSYNTWQLDRNHSKATEVIRSGNERIIDVTGNIEDLKFSKKNTGDALTRTDKQYNIQQRPREVVNSKNFKETKKPFLSNKGKIAGTCLVTTNSTLLTLIFSQALMASTVGLGVFILAAIAMSISSDKGSNQAPSHVTNLKKGKETVIDKILNNDTSPSKGINR
jgi:hypothetical protein